MQRLTPWFVWLAACGFDMNMGTPAHDAPAGGDAGVDAEIDAPAIDAPDLCIGEGVNEVCFAALPTAPIQIAGSETLDTSVAATCTPTTNPGASGWCVIAGTQFDVMTGSIVRVLGDKPVVFATTGDMTIVGTIDAGSRGNAIGAGANSVQCVAGTAATAGNSSGGGYGGSFGGKGANGEGADGGAGGVAPAPAGAVTVLRGGCAGGRGGPIGGVFAEGGAGGGGLALLSRTKIRVLGTLNASGAGGRVGELVRQGSGGGGSGGMIILDAPIIDADGARIFANGGGGGEGNDLVNVGVGGTEPLGPTQPGTGGAGVSSGGDGGAGSLGMNGGAPPMNAASANAGGGGGGGGAGVIISRVVPLTGADVSPVPVGTPPL
ncbi:MAG: hypothetical protein AB7T06_42160 [Kofleriaceae bacterium]